MQSITIVGPNLPQILARRGEFHVHTTGCSDLQRGLFRQLRPFDFITVELDSQRELVEFMYDGQIQDNPDADWSTYLDEFHFAPCVKLPVESSDHD